MFERFAKWVVGLQLKYPKRILIVFLILNLLFIPGILNIINNIEPSLEKVLPQDIEEIKTMNQMRSDFGADMVLLVMYADGTMVDVRDPEYLRYVNIISSKIQTRDHVVMIQSVVDVFDEVTGIPNTIVESKDVFENNLNSKNFVSHDKSFTVMKIQTNVGSSAKTIDKLITEIENDIESSEMYNPGVKTKITGFAAIDRAIFQIILTDFGLITFVAMFAIMVIVFLTFKSLAKGMLPMIIVMNSLIWTMGIVGYLGLTITVISMVAAAMIMGLGIDFGIHQIHTYFDERKKHSPEKSLELTLVELMRAMIAASMTTISGFLALLFGVLTAMKVLGIILSVGIFTTLIGAIFLLPVVVYLYDRDNGNNIIKQ